MKERPQVVTVGHAVTLDPSVHDVDARGWFHVGVVTCDLCDEPAEDLECPSEHCLMCNGSACNKCGAGCWNNAPQEGCEHDVMERHEDPVTVCSGCYAEIDDTVCHCGTDVDKHGYWAGHSPVPMGCVCHLRNQT